MEATFENTMDILVKAYLNDTLKHGDCAACAVGNLCGGKKEWAHLFFTTLDGVQTIAPKGQLITHTVSFFGFKEPKFPENTTHKKWLNEAEDLIKSTGYSKRQLAKIEFAFENASKGESDDDWMFNGLMAVLEVVAQIHGKDFSDKKVYEDKFTEIFASK